MDDGAFSYVEDDGSTESSGDICARCGAVRADHSEKTGEGPRGCVVFKEGA